MSIILGLAAGALTYIVLHVGLGVPVLATYVACASVGVLLGALLGMADA